MTDLMTGAVLRPHRHPCLPFHPSSLRACFWLCAMILLAVATPTRAPMGATVTFDTVTAGATSYAVDIDGDLIDDLVFSTTDPAGFNPTGPGGNQLYVSEPGLEGSTIVAGADLRVDFLFGAFGPLDFGFAVNNIADLTGAVSFSVFDAMDTLLASVSADAMFTLPDGVTPSSFPEGQLSASFGWASAAYALFEFNDAVSGERFIIDNFSGTFVGSRTIHGIPEPATLALLAIGLAVACGAARGGRPRPAA